MTYEETGSSARRVALLWRRVRWGAAVFCAVQFAAYTPGPGVDPPYPLLPIGLVLAALVAVINVAAMAAERWNARVPQVDDRPARRDGWLLVADTTVVIAVVELFAFDPGVAVWALLVLPVLEAGLLGQLRLALWTCGACVVALVARELLATGWHDLALPPTAVMLSSLGYRSGVLLLVALVVGVQASVSHEYVELLRAARRRLEHDAGHDHLTGVATRGLFLERARRRLLGVGPGAQIGVLFVDCDHFKRVNDQEGHAIGDMVLVEVARRLGEEVRSSDTVARIGGDEFAVLLADIAAADAHQLARRVRAVLAQPYRQPGLSEPVRMSCSVGLALSDGPGDTLSGLLRRADVDMYRHKQPAR